MSCFSLHGYQPLPWSILWHYTDGQGLSEGWRWSSYLSSLHEKIAVCRMIRDPGVQESPISFSLCGSMDGGTAFPTESSHLNRLKTMGCCTKSYLPCWNAGSYGWLLKCFYLYCNPPLPKSKGPALQTHSDLSPSSTWQPEMLLASSLPADHCFLPPPHPISCNSGV